MWTGVTGVIDSIVYSTKLTSLTSGSMETEEMDEGELTRILGLMNEQSASLILMLLCDNSLDLHQVEVESDSEELESRLQAVKSVTGFPSRADIARASRNFTGRFYSGGEVVSFTHPKLHIACAHALYTLNPCFVLQHCSLTFLHERVRHLAARSTAMNDDQHTIYVSEMHYDIIASRLAEATEQGNYSLSLSHAMLQEEAIVDKLFQQLKSRNYSSVLLSKTDSGKYILQWAVKVQSVHLVKQLVTSGFHFSEREVTKGLQTCVCYGSVQVFEHLFTKYNTIISPLHIKRAFRAAIDSHRTEIVVYLRQYGAGIAELSFDRQRKLFHIAFKLENVMLCEEVLYHALPNINFADSVSVIFRNKPPTMLRKICNELLRIACNDGCMPLAQIVVTLSDINDRDQFGRTPIMDAAYKCRNDIFYLLSTKGADLTLTDKYGDTVLLHACFGGSTSIVDQILPLFDINSRGHNGWTPLMIAGYVGKKELFDLLMAKGADITATDNYGDTVLHLTCRGGSATIVDSLLATFDINIRGHNKWTPVMTAAYNGKAEVFDLLMTKGVDLTLTNKCGNAAIHFACQGGNVSIVDKLLLSCDINIRGGDGATPVMMAAQHGQEEIFDLLMARGADLCLTDNDGDTVLHSACLGRSLEIVKRILSLFDINVKGWNSHTPLMRAIGGGNINVFELLLSHEADVTLIDDDGDSLLHLACESGHLDIVKRVLPFSDITLRNITGWTPVMEALTHGHTEVFQYLMDENADLTLVDSVGDDMLTLAYRGGCADIVRKLTPAGAEIMEIEKWTEMMIYLVHGHFRVLEGYKRGDPDLIQRDGFGDTLLHLASRGGNKKCVEYLLPCYDINVRGRHDWTPVMMAAYCGHLDVFLCLLSHQADLALVSDTGENVLTFARRGGNEDIVTYLMNLPEFKDRA